MISIRNAITPSATVMMNSLAQKKKAAGERVYNLSAGEPLVAPAPEIVNAAIEAIEAGRTQYPPISGVAELRTAAATWLQTTYKTNFSAEQILVTCGGKFGLYALARTLLGAGDEVIVIAPFWTSYATLVEMTGATGVLVTTEVADGWKVTPAQLRAVITENTKIIFFNNAGNPTGALYSRSEIHDLLTVAAEHNVLVVSDEVYGGLVYEGEFVSAGSFPEFADNVVVIQSMSKHFAMTGWRVGLVCGPKHLITALTDLQSQSTTGTSIISQYAAVGALNNSASVNARVKSALQTRRDVLVGALSEKFNHKFAAPLAGLYLLVALADLGVEEADDLKFCTELLEQGNVALVPGTPFGAPGYVRFSFGAEPEELVAAVVALADYLGKGK